MGIVATTSAKTAKVDDCDGLPVFCCGRWVHFPRRSYRSSDKFRWDCQYPGRTDDSRKGRCSSKLLTCISLYSPVSPSLLLILLNLPHKACKIDNTELSTAPHCPLFYRALLIQKSFISADMCVRTVTRHKCLHAKKTDDFQYCENAYILGSGKKRMCRQVQVRQVQLSVTCGAHHCWLSRVSGMWDWRRCHQGLNMGPKCDNPNCGHNICSKCK